VPRVKKRTWASARTQLNKNQSRKVGTCIHCKNEVLSDDSFIVFATKLPAHFRCYQKDYEKENRKNIYL
jgi:hypothetical protein